MAKEINKGSGLNNVSETWDRNERESGNAPGGAGAAASDAATGNEELDKVIREEAAEYDHSNKEDRVLGGDRATVNDNGEGADDPA